MPSYRKRSFRRRRRPYAKRTYRRKGYRRSYRKRYRRRGYGRRRRSYKTTYVWRKYGSTQSWTPGVDIHPWGTTTNPMPVQANGVADWASLKSTWNYYKICKAITFWKVPGNAATEGAQYDFTSYAPGAVQTRGYEGPWIGSYKDPDGTNYVTNEVQLLKEPSVSIRHLRPGSKISRSWRPTWLAPAYRLGATFGYMPKRGYLTTDYDTVLHYGMVWDWNQGQLGAINLPCYYETWILIGLRSVDRGKPRMTV